MLADQMKNIYQFIKCEIMNNKIILTCLYCLAIALVAVVIGTKKNYNPPPPDITSSGPIIIDTMPMKGIVLDFNISDSTKPVAIKTDSVWIVKDTARALKFLLNQIESMTKTQELYERELRKCRTENIRLNSGVLPVYTKEERRSMQQYILQHQ
jgi:hypothetical protein